MSATRIGEDVFEAYTDRVEVTSLHRVDPSWRFVDSAGHEHSWYSKGVPVTSYSPSESYDLPTLERVEDEPAYYDGDEIPQFHRECKICREHVRPGFTADTCQQYVAGITRYTVNGEGISLEEYKMRVEAALQKWHEEQG